MYSIIGPEVIIPHNKPSTDRPNIEVLPNESKQENDHPTVNDDQDVGRVAAIVIGIIVALALIVAVVSTTVY